MVLRMLKWWSAHRSTIQISGSRSVCVSLRDTRQVDQMEEKSIEYPIRASLERWQIENVAGSNTPQLNEAQPL